MSDKARGLGRSFHALNITQFLGALNDNVFKLLLIFLLLRVLGNEHRTQIIAMASLVFVLPFLLFSHAAGVLADRLSKRQIVVATKIMEVCVMTIGTVAVYLASPALTYVVLFLMCTQSAFFGPNKYGIIPELVSDEDLSRANSRLVALSYLAIIIGTFLPAFLLETILNHSHVGLALVCMLIAGVGVATSLGIGKTPAQGTDKHFTPFFVAEIFRTVRSLSFDRYLQLAVFAAAYFLFIGAFIQQNTLLLAHDHLGMTWERGSYLFTVAALGIGLGALAAGRLSGRTIEFGIVPIGALGLALVCVLLGLAPPSITTTVVLMFFLGLFSGLFIVPLNAFIQLRSPAARRGEILAAQSFLSFLGVALSAGLILLLGRLGVTPEGNFIVIGVLTGLLALVTGYVLPDFLVRFMVVIVGRFIYRIRVSGETHIPASGPALLISNHVTWADAVLLSSLTPRRIRFMMSREIMENHWLGFMFRLMNVIPVSMNDGPRKILNSLRAAREAMDEGYLVCIFAEGSLTRNGNLRAFRPGFERIVKGTDYPVIPIHIGGAWGSVLSYYHGRLLAARPRELPYPIWLAVGAPMPATATVDEVRLRISELGGATFGMKRSPRRTLAHAYVRMARHRWFMPALSDTTGKRLSFGKTLISSLALARVIDPLVKDQTHVGVVLPTTVAGALVNAALTLTGRVPVNLNYTASREGVAYAVEQSGIRTTIASRAFLEKLDSFDAPEGTVFLEDLAPRISGGVKAQALLKALFAPVSMMFTHRRPGPDDLATIIFSSGSTGVPKGVMLTHHNIMSNMEAFGLVFAFKRADRICAVLPFFHSFGFTTTLWAPLCLGFSAHYHPNPIDAGTIVDMIRDEKLTVMMSTPTFLLAYMRKATPEHFATIRTIVTGAEKLKKRVADAFEERCGVRPLEGYGTTELSPVVGVNVEDVTDGIPQVGSKDGSIGHPIPGVAVRIVDPDTETPLPVGREGLLLVKGPNVMKGYLNEPEKTAEVLKDGWYNTGDIARIDEDGFVFLTDRLSRFSKIGGEMVPHLALEEKLLDGLGAVGPVVAVSATPDERKGEQIVVLYTSEAGTAEDVARVLDESDLPNLWKPKKQNIFKIDKMPTLGSGKLDLKGLKEAAHQAVESRTS